MFGQILRVVSRYAGTSTVGIEAIGQTIISVDSLRDFPLDTGVVDFGAGVSVYNAVDRINSTITLAVALAAALPAGADVKVFPYSIQRWAFVQPDNLDVPTDAVWCLLPHALAAFVAEDGPRVEGGGEMVQYVRDEQTLLITDVKDRLPQINPDAIPDGAITETKITPGSITTPLLAANAVATQHLQFGAATGDKLSANALDGKTITGALIRTAAVGKRLELTTSGLVQIDAAGNVILSIGDQNKFTGEIDATSEIIRDSLQLFGRNNLFATGSKVTLKASASAPTQAPTLSWDYEPGPAPSLSGLFVTGVHGTGGTVHSTTELYASVATFKRATGHKWTFPTIVVDGVNRPEYKPWHMIRIAKLDNGAERVVMIGEDWNRMNGAYPEVWVRIYDDSTLLTDGSVAPILKHSFKFADFSWFRQYKLIRYAAGTGLRHWFGIAYSDSPVVPTGTKSLKMNWYYYLNSDDGATLDSTTDWGPDFLWEDFNLSGGVIGTRTSLGLDTSGGGASNIMVVFFGGESNDTNIVYDVTAATWDTNSYFPQVFQAQNRAWVEGDPVNGTATAFYGYNWAAGTDVTSSKYAAHHKRSATPPAVWGTYAWRGEATQSFKTTMAPQASISYRSMARLRVTMPALPAPIAGVGAARDPLKDVYGWVYYLGSGATIPARTSMFEQSNTPALAPGVALTVTSVTLSTPVVLSGTNPNATSTFPASQPATIESDNGLLIITGDGEITTKKLTVTDPLVVNAITLGVNQTWTPTFSASGGTITSVSAPYTEWMYIHPDLIYFSIQINVVTVGTATGAMFFTLPVAAASGSRYFGGREDAVTGSALQCINIGGSDVKCLRADNTTPIIAGTANIISGTYRPA